MRVGLLLLIWTCAGSAWAQGLAYSPIDRATGRVLAVKRVETQRLDGPQGEQVVAVPVLGHGSGVVISRSGLMLTAHHVVKDAAALAVKLPGRSHAHPARVVHVDAERDFALLQLPGTFEHYATLPEHPRGLRVREQVFAVGYPIDPNLKHPLSSPGSVAGELEDGNVQLGMSLNPGNSGGPLIDAQERVVGIVIARGDPAQGVLGLGVALPIRHALTVVRRQQRPAHQLEQQPWKREHHEVAHLVATLVNAGPVALLRSASKQLESGETERVVGLLEGLAERRANPDLLVLGAAYLWDAVVMMVADYGGIERLVQGAAPDKRRHAVGLLRRAVELCRRAGRQDPSVRLRSAFADHVLRQWPDVGRASGASVARAEELGAETASDSEVISAFSSP